MKVRNWEKYQHYKDRNPPWVKWYYDTLSSRWWIALDGKHRELALVCILIASRHDGEVPNDIDYVRQVGHIKSKSTFKPLLQCRFLETDSQTETETETETEALASASTTLASATRVEFLRFWEAYPKKRGKGAARKAWNNAKGRPAIDAILAAIEAQKSSPDWLKDGGQYVPNPATWLNQERWSDEVMRAVTIPSIGMMGRGISHKCPQCGQLSPTFKGSVCSDCAGDTMSDIDEIETALRSLLQGEFSSLSIDFNDHHGDYQKAATAVDSWLCENTEWASDEERDKAKATDSVWSVQWYPRTPVGFCSVSASTLRAAIEAAVESLNEACGCARGK